MASSTTNGISSAAQAHVAVVPFPFSSHAGSLFSLARSLGALAPSSHFSFLSTNHSLASLRKQLPFPSNISLVPISDGVTSSAAPNHFEAIELFLKSFKVSLREGLKEAELAEGRKVGCIISDAFVWLAADVADEMAVKWVPVRTGAPLDLYVRLNADMIRETVGDEAIKSYGDELLSFLPCLANHRASDLPLGVINGDPNFVYHVICDRMARRLSDSDVLVTNTFQRFDPMIDSYFKLKFPNYYPVGPFHILNPSPSEPPTDSYGCLPWLDRHDPATVAYVSLGTLAILPSSELTSLAKGLEASGVPFLWSLRHEAQSLLPPGYIDRMNETGKGKIVPWTPQSSVLQHSALGAFVTHCGWNSVLESIVGGVPMVCRPFFGDQTINARSISHIWKFGVALDGGFTEKGVVRALDVVFKREEGKKMRNKVNELKAMVSEAVSEYGTSRENLKRLVKIVCGC